MTDSVSDKGQDPVAEGVAQGGGGSREGVNEIWNIPNILCILRIATAPLLILMLIGDPGPKVSMAAAIIFTVVCITDWLDGYIARKQGIVTNLGKFLDPLADKVLIITAFIMLIPIDRIPAWIVALIIGREVLVTGLRSIAVESGIVIHASSLGKVKTIVQIVALVPLIAHYTFFGLNFHTVGIVFLWPAFILTMWSGADYFHKFFKTSL